MSRWARLTVPEGMVLVGLLLIPITLFAAWFLAARLERGYRAVQEDLSAIRRACQLYFEEYGRWPTDRENAYGDMRYGREYANALVMNALRAVSGPGNFNHTRNPEKIIFLEAGSWRPGVSGLDGEGAFLDAWGMPYQMVLDADLNNRCDMEHSIYPAQEDTGVVVWSCGPDRISDTADDLLGWVEE